MCLYMCVHNMRFLSGNQAVHVCKEMEYMQCIDRCTDDCTIIDST